MGRCCVIRILDHITNLCLGDLNDRDVYHARGGKFMFDILVCLSCDLVLEPDL